MAPIVRTRTIETGDSVAERSTLRVIAVFEAIKGAAAFAAAVGMLDLMHHDVRHLALELIGHFGLNPDARYPAMVLHYAALLPGANLRLLMVLAFGYVLTRLLESYGLWNNRTWGEWLGALGGGLYIPFEVAHLLHRPSAIGAAVLAGNVLVVSFLAYQLWRRRKSDRVRP
jgi:uncharacterized membrane protein (DUF2068 family)